MGEEIKCSQGSCSETSLEADSHASGKRLPALLGDRELNMVRSGTDWYLLGSRRLEHQERQTLACRQVQLPPLPVPTRMDHDDLGVGQVGETGSGRWKR